MAAKNHLFGNTTDLLQNLQCILNCLPAAGRAGDRLINDSTPHQVDSAIFTGKSIDPDDADILVPQLLQSTGRSQGHVIVVSKDGVDIPQMCAVCPNDVLRRIARFTDHVYLLDLNIPRFINDTAKSFASVDAGL